MVNKIGLALSGGGARGFSHVGALQVFAENGITFDLIAGTSAGSIIGGALAAGLNADQITELANSISFTKVLGPTLPLRGVVSNAPLGRLIKKNFPVTRFEDLEIPLATVAFDLGLGEKVVSTSGDLITAIRASCAVPGVFTPVRDELGRTLVDGGVVSPLPTEVAREMGADIVIAVDLNAHGSSFRLNSYFGAGIMMQSVMAMVQALGIGQHHFADVVISPNIAHLRMDQISKRDEFIRLGREAAAEKLDEIKALIAKS